MRRKSAAERLRKERMLTVLYAILACTGAVTLTLLAFSAITSSIDVSDGAFTVMSSIVLCAGCFAASYTAAKRKRKNGLKTGLVCGIVIFLTALSGGIIFVRSFSFGGIFTKMLIILVCSSLGGIIGVNSPHRFR